jgi:hypothetical protein
MKNTNGRAPPQRNTYRPPTYRTAKYKLLIHKRLKIKVMETKIKNNGTAINNNNKADKKTAFVNNNPVNKDNKEVAKPQPEAEKPKEETAGVKTEQPKQQAEPAKTEAPKAEQVNEQPKAEVKAEPKAEPQPEAKPAKPVLNLEETLKLVAELNRRKIQRDKLIETIENLEAFEIAIKEDEDETYGNIYQGCVLTIEDDNKRKFTTKNPVIIWTVAQQVNSMCVNKLSEIEAGIMLPQ